LSNMSGNTSATTILELSTHSTTTTTTIAYDAGSYDDSSSSSLLGDGAVCRWVSPSHPIARATSRAPMKTSTTATYSAAPSDQPVLLVFPGANGLFRTAEFEWCELTAGNEAYPGEYVEADEVCIGVLKLNLDTLHSTIADCRQETARLGYSYFRWGGRGHCQMFDECLDKRPSTIVWEMWKVRWPCCTPCTMRPC